MTNVLLEVGMGHLGGGINRVNTLIFQVLLHFHVAMEGNFKSSSGFSEAVGEYLPPCAQAWC